jgi:hypothetical protein
MRMIRCLPAMLACMGMYGQEPPQSKTPATYQVEYTIHDGSDAAAKGGRRYAVILDDQGSRVFVRSGAKVPYTVATGASTQWNYADIGVNIDSRLNERAGKLVLYTSFEMSALADKPRDAPMVTVNQLRADSYTVMTPAKPATILTVNDAQTQKNVRVDAVLTALR